MIQDSVRQQSGHPTSKLRRIEVRINVHMTSFQRYVTAGSAVYKKKKCLFFNSLARQKCARWTDEPTNKALTPYPHGSCLP